MTSLDWAVLLATVVLIVGYGLFRARRVRDADAYLRGTGDLRWLTIGLSVMATQASAVTFVSVPGQAYEDGLRFIQFYLGLPLAILVVVTVLLPLYRRAGVYTAYEYLERRFGRRTRLLGALLFLVQRGLAVGISLYAPSIVLSSILGWPLGLTTLVVGGTVMLYTVTGGTQIVSQTQRHQMMVMLAGLVAAAVVVIARLPPEVGFVEAASLGGALGRMKALELRFDPSDRYNLWSGLFGGFFLALAYFGTDQSQVQRYLTSRSLTESRLGLLFHAVVKIPMQLGVLVLGVLVFAYYMFAEPPVWFDAPAWEQATQATPEAQALQDEHHAAVEARREAAHRYVAAQRGDSAAAAAEAQSDLRRSQGLVQDVRDRAAALVERTVPDADPEDADHIFLTFVLDTLPAGLVGLLVATILFAGMSSMASELSALGATTTVDLVGSFRPKAVGSIRLARLFTLLWGGVALAFATWASRFDNLIEAINIVGSLFYGTMLGLFVVAVGLRRVDGDAVFPAAVVAQTTVLVLFVQTSLGYLWFNLVGCALVVLVASALAAVRARA